MGWHGVYIVDWLITPDDEALPERRGSERMQAGSMNEAANELVVRLGFDAADETITLRTRRATARGELPPLPSPRDG